MSCTPREQNVSVYPDNDYIMTDNLEEISFGCVY